MRTVSQRAAKPSCVTCPAGRWGPRRCQGIRDKFHISVSGDNIPPPLPAFDMMKFPPPINK